MEHDGLLTKKNKRNVRENITAYAFLSPWIIGFILFSGVPIIASFVLSLTKWDLISTPRFIGLGNFIAMFSAGSDFWNVLKVTLIFTVFSIIATLTWSFFLAMLLNFKLKGIGIFRFFFFVPAVMPSIALAFAFQLLYNKEIGVINYILYLFGINNGPNWLMDNHLVIPSIIFVCLYTYTTGQMMLIFDASLKEVPKELYEACAIDGASYFQKFYYVTLPYISPVILFNLVIATINAFNGSFSIIYPLTFGGPGDASRVISLAIYDSGFKTFRMGYASALATVAFIMVVTIALLQFKLSDKFVYYEN
ncbi:MAG: sugar ABC transporter permease [Actinobacteria bacterium]|nr:sugar ABC transporter permease [Actinomycetota bacterium]